jgi:predicted ribosome quality control (RQC) complex YloA/Tae2 family protein
MPIDAFAVTALRIELSAALEGGRIDKITMPAKNEVILSGRAVRGPFRLLLSAQPQRARAHLTAVPRENPQQPPMFCMLLRKHLSNGRFAGIVQPQLERVLHFHWDAADEMGIISRKTLTVEMMGRHSNIILTGADGRVVDCLRRVDPEMSPGRPVLPGLFYRDPPGQGKTDPTHISHADFTALLACKGQNISVTDCLLNTFTAFSPILCRDIASDPMSRFFEIMQLVKDNDFTPGIIKDGADFFVLPLKTVPQTPFDGSLSELLDALYTERGRQEHLSQRASSLIKNARNTRGKLLRKLTLLRREYEQAQDREHLRQKGDLLMANLHKIKRGDGEVTVEDFYNGNVPLTVILDPSKPPQSNAAALYKAYAKAKNAGAAITGQIAQAERDLEYWESVLDQLSRIGNEHDLLEIRDEITPPKQQRGKALKVAMPMRFRSTDGMIFRAGRNNRQNDLLTMKMASKNDIWLHVQKIPGCHVVIETGGLKDGTVPERTLAEAAGIAAWFSAAKESPKVPVDYTPVRNVKKPPGAKPGMVIYDKFKTLLVGPAPELAIRLLAD